MGMAYRRAWLLVQSLNDGCGAPVVETARGGRGRGGAVLTPLGAELVHGYRRMEARMREAIETEVRELEARLPRHRPSRVTRR
jgi:molybdate transport system regulatory protein